MSNVFGRGLTLFLEEKEVVLRLERNVELNGTVLGVFFFNMSTCWTMKGSGKVPCSVCEGNLLGHIGLSVADIEPMPGGSLHGASGKVEPFCVRLFAIPCKVNVLFAD